MSDLEIALGAIAALRLGAGSFVVRAPVRVVSVVDEPRRRGFAYGTLPGHPECGEESFTLHRDHEGAVRLEIVAFSRPGSTLTRLSGPAGRLVQRWMTSRYLRVLEQP